MIVHYISRQASHLYCNMLSSILLLLVDMCNGV